MKKRMLCLILPILSLVLEIMPYGAVCNFAMPATDGSIGRFRELYSYFDLTPFGYANFAPLITAVTTCVIVLLLLAYVAVGKQRNAMIARNILFACVIFSLGPLLLGIRFYSVVGALITASQIAEWFLLGHMIKKQGSRAM